jgi:hypothetical protein
MGTRSVARVGGKIETYRRMPLVEWTVSKGRVHLSPPAGKAIDLIGGAASVWAVLDRPRTLAEVMSEIIELDPAIDQPTVASILNDMVSQSLVAREVLEKDLAV